MYRQFKYALIIFAAVSAVVFSNGAAALELERGQVAVQGSIEQFRWQEFDNGGRLLKEHGPLFALGATWNNLRRSAPGVLYNIDGRLYFGSVDYNGQACDLAQNCTPSNTKTDYSGLQVDGLAGYHFGARSGFDLFGGVGLDEWTREIKDTPTASGGTEDYLILYTKLGAGFSSNSPAYAYRFRAGIKYPFYTYEHANGVDNGVTLSPGKRVSGFARFDAEFGAKNKGHFGFAAFYESFRFSTSDKESATINGTPVLVWQPESHMDVYGLQVAYYFF